jgi:hypothetical protein
MLPKRRKFKWNKSSKDIQNHIKNRDMIWESQNGKQTDIKGMDINHLKNAIAKIKREGNWRKYYLNILEMEVIYRKVFNTEIKKDEPRKQRILRTTNTTEDN